MRVLFSPILKVSILASVGSCMLLSSAFASEGNESDGKIDILIRHILKAEDSGESLNSVSKIQEKMYELFNGEDVAAELISGLRNKLIISSEQAQDLQNLVSDSEALSQISENLDPESLPSELMAALEIGPSGNSFVTDNNESALILDGVVNYVVPVVVLVALLAGL